MRKKTTLNHLINIFTLKQIVNIHRNTHTERDVYTAQNSRHTVYNNYPFTKRNHPDTPMNNGTKWNEEKKC